MQRREGARAGNDFEVVIAGAGPVGLFLACELGLAGVSVLVLERDATTASPRKGPGLGMRGLNTAAVEAFYRRGLLDSLFDPRERAWTVEATASFQYAGNFAGIALDANRLRPARWTYKLPGPALLPGTSDLERIEGVLSGRARELGVAIERGAGVTGLVQDDEGVTVSAGARSVRAGWLVGCDGGRSVVRKSAGFEFVGSDATCAGYVFRGALGGPGRLSPGFHRTPRGLYVVGDSGRSM
ncbi:FAD-dependent monooxygenase [Nannocystis sp. ILAH1]|uniref:FAD-dependent monooxygenase n=1 Tax=Nannocystis sp. ILAH1 TaxID=2996789 RepID=UPI00226E9CCC|nr:FAD-dependent monooxygenase [Nannocystis sp. ILAH1]MCY0993088.1 FAD-dependent monooxygenase [Nannocystis sp. ILAH1]